MMLVVTTDDSTCWINHHQPVKPVIRQIASPCPHQHIRTVCRTRNSLQQVKALLREKWDGRLGPYHHINGRFGSCKRNLTLKEHELEFWQPLLILRRVRLNDPHSIPIGAQECPLREAIRSKGPQHRNNHHAADDSAYIKARYHHRHDHRQQPETMHPNHRSYLDQRCFDPSVSQ